MYRGAVSVLLLAALIGAVRAQCPCGGSVSITCPNIVTNNLFTNWQV